MYENKHYEWLRGEAGEDMDEPAKEAPRYGFRGKGREGECADDDDDEETSSIGGNTAMTTHTMRTRTTRSSARTTITKRTLGGVEQSRSAERSRASSASAASAGATTATRQATKASSRITTTVRSVAASTAITRKTAQNRSELKQDSQLLDQRVSEQGFNQKYEVLDPWRRSRLWTVGEWYWKCSRCGYEIRKPTSHKLTVASCNHWVYTHPGLKRPDSGCRKNHRPVEATAVLPAELRSWTCWKCGDGLPLGMSKRHLQASRTMHMHKCGREQVMQAFFEKRLCRKRGQLQAYGHDVGRTKVHTSIAKDGTETNIWGYGCKSCARFAKNLKTLKEHECGGEQERHKNLQPIANRVVVWKDIFGYRQGRLLEGFRKVVGLTADEEKHIKQSLAKKGVRVNGRR